MPDPTPPPKRPRVVIVGGGFGGLAVARGLCKAPIDVILVDRANHHLFQPLLYQVATSILPPGDIGTPIRQLVAEQANTSVFMAELSGVDPKRRQVLIDYLNQHGVPFKYDYLVLATGASHNYFGHEEFAEFAPGLKQLTDATTIRDRILRAFEIAEEVDDPQTHQDLLTFVLVGGGATGVELAGSIAELRRFTLEREFRRVNPNQARIILIEGSDRLLHSFIPTCRAPRKRLEALGVEVRTGVHVTKIDAGGVMLGDERIASRTVVWTAGVKPSPAAKWLDVPADKAGRVVVQNDCSVPDREGVFVIGDTACFTAADGKPLPGVAQVALQQGQYVANVIRARLEGQRAPGPFKYFDKGSMAIVGRNFAVMEAGRIRLSGFLAWIAWATIHVLFLAAFGNRVSVMSQWIWTYLSHKRGSRLILGSGGKNPLYE